MGADNRARLTLLDLIMEDPVSSKLGKLLLVPLSYSPPLEKGHIEDGGIGIDKLQQESFEDQALFKGLLGFRNLCKGRTKGMRLR